MIDRPMELIKKVGAWFSKDRRFVFLSALGIALLSNFLTLVYMFTSQDALMYGNVFTSGAWEASIGRWAVAFFTSARGGRVAMPVTGVAACVFMALAAMLTVDIFEIKSGVFSFITAALFGSAPMLTVMLLYDHLADAYIFKILAAALSVYCMTKIKNKLVSIITSGLFLMISMALYQNMIGYIVGMPMMLFVLAMFDMSVTVKESLKKLLHAVICCVAGGVFYVIGSMIALKYYGVGMASYNGAMSSSPVDFILNLPKGILGAYKTCLAYFMGNSVIYNSAWRRPHIFACFLALLVIVFVLSVISKKIYKEKSRLILAIVVAALIPLGLNVIFVIAGGSNEPYAINTEQMIIILPFALKLFEMTEPAIVAKKTILGITRGVSVLVATVLVAISVTTYIGADFYSEMYMKQTWDQTMKVADRLLDRMETADGYEVGMPIIINGMVCDQYWQRDNAYEPYTLGNIVTNQISHYSLMMTGFSWSNIYRLHFGANMNIVLDPVLYNEIVSTDEYKEMGVFPSRDSVMVIDGVMVVNLMEEIYE